MPKHQKARNVRESGFRPVANPALAAAMRDLRRSSAASKHDTRPARQRTRSTSRNAAIRDHS